MMTFVFGTILPWLLLAVGSWLGYQLVRQNGRILLRLEAIEKRLGALPAEQRRESQGLTIGTLAPDFELPDLDGVRHKLSEFRGKDLLLIFFNPKCGYCTKMAADLAALPVEDGGGRAVPVVVTTGDADENRRLVAQHGVRGTVLLQDQREVASQYRAQGTPMGYRIDAAGRIASELAVTERSFLSRLDEIRQLSSTATTQIAVRALIDELIMYLGAEMRPAMSPHHTSDHATWPARCKIGRLAHTQFHLSNPGTPRLHPQKQLSRKSDAVRTGWPSILSKILRGVVRRFGEIVRRDFANQRFCGRP